ncbi:hypothetical protein CTEN210_11505 [Chaetoceros tenuissimus]|uniref:B30.2/SPRY domain-containing protein n=1 Tax=Chaetoceros tenuissimus TaxID=426638 RepID=A0AAD3CZV5_9STRA|nr:hypothetical protein CTEN210_11505 [Chaetoceros tenuissimus]
MSVETFYHTSAATSFAFSDNLNKSRNTHQQIIIKVDHEKSHVLQFHKDEAITKESILLKLSQASKIPAFMLKIRYPKHSTSYPLFLSAYTHLPIRGGKGGFGTLLKGQSKKAGARQTTDFGACRDLNGRRLRHVNDDLKLQQWKQFIQRRKEQGKDPNALIDVEEELRHMKTASGVRNWHLAVPSWGAGEITGKSRYKEERKMRRELEQWAKVENEKVLKRLEHKRSMEKNSIDYAALGEERARLEQEKLARSIREGMKKQKMGPSEDVGGQTKRRKIHHDYDDDDDDLMDESSSILCTLSGDVVTDSVGGKNMIQSKSEFATAAILLNGEMFQSKRSKFNGLYYEVTIETEGVAQIGWAKSNCSSSGQIQTTTGTDSFLPNSDTGDGVGDDAFSYGYDGLRGKIFYNGKETSYSLQDANSWKKGDVIGCCFDYKEGAISFSVNGENIGKAFDVDTSLMLHPAMSLNENEIIEINVGPSFQFCPKNYMAVSDIIATKQDTIEKKDDEKKEHVGEEIRTTIQGIMLPETKAKAKKPTPLEQAPATEMKSNEPIILDDYKDVKELEALGMDRLKEELYRLGLKCGGGLGERAKRLFAIKGLKKEDIPKKLRGKNFEAVKPW